MIISNSVFALAHLIPAEEFSIFSTSTGPTSRKDDLARFFYKNMPTEKLTGYLDSHNPMRRGQAEKVLTTLIRSNGVVMKKHQFMEKLVAQGQPLSTREEDKIQPLSRRAFFRADNAQQSAHEKKIKEAGKKTVRYIGDYEVGAFEFSYATYLSNNSVAELEGS